MRSVLLIALMMLSPAKEAGLEEQFASIRSVVQGRAAFCKPSVVDELQIIGEPRKLSGAEVSQIAKLFGAEETWFEKLPNGRFRATERFGMPYTDFKFLLYSLDGAASVAIRLSTTSREAAVYVNGERLKLPTIQPAAMSELKKILNAWFPRWEEITAKNLKDHLQARREKRL